jgi:hypothetical protein
MNLKSHIIKSVVGYVFFFLKKERTQIKSFQIQKRL